MEPSFLLLQRAYLEGKFNILTCHLMWLREFCFAFPRKMLDKDANLMSECTFYRIE